MFIFQDIVVNNKFASTSRYTTSQISFPNNAQSGPVTLLVVEAPEQISDVSTLTTIPSESSCREMIDTIRLGGYAAISCSLGTYNERSLETLLKVHTLREISAKVKEEEQWLNKAFNCPDDNCISVQEDVDVYKKRLLNTPDGHYIFEHNKTILASDIATLAGSRWLHYSILSGIVELLRKNDTETCTFLLNELLLMDNVTLREYIRKLEGTPKYLTFISLVGKSKEVFLSSPNRKGCHWTITYVDLVTNTWFYCDTLGWSPPSDLKKEINRILEAFYKVQNVCRKPFHGCVSCHVPCATYKHSCSSKCFQSFPLQTCETSCNCSKSTHSLEAYFHFPTCQSSCWFSMVARPNISF